MDDTEELMLETFELIVLTFEFIVPMFVLIVPILVLAVLTFDDTVESVELMPLTAVLIV